MSFPIFVLVCCTSLFKIYMELSLDRNARPNNGQNYIKFNLSRGHFYKKIATELQSYRHPAKGTQYTLGENFLCLISINSLTSLAG